MQKGKSMAKKNESYCVLAGKCRATLLFKITKEGDGVSGLVSNFFLSLVNGSAWTGKVAEKPLFGISGSGGPSQMYEVSLIWDLIVEEIVEFKLFAKNLEKRVAQELSGVYKVESFDLSVDIPVVEAETLSLDEVAHA
jgi:hypothetical protein